MTTAKPDIRMPYWPLFLSREEAARYLGVSPSTFDAEVDAGLWPPARRRGAKGGRLTWYRPDLEMTAERGQQAPSLGDANDYETRRAAARHKNRHETNPGRP